MEIVNSHTSSTILDSFWDILLLTWSLTLCKNLPMVKVSYLKLYITLETPTLFAIVFIASSKRFGIHHFLAIVTTTLTQFMGQRDARAQQLCLLGLRRFFYSIQISWFIIPFHGILIQRLFIKGSNLIPLSSSNVTECWLIIKVSRSFPVLWHMPLLKLLSNLCDTFRYIVCLFHLSLRIADY